MSPRATPNETDAELMRRVQADDDSDAFALLYDRHARLALWVARSVLRDAAHAEESVQEGFLSMWQGRATYMPKLHSSFRAWAMLTVRNRAIDSSRRDAAAKRPPVGDSEVQTIPDSSNPSALDGIIFRNEVADLHASLRRIPDAQSEVISLAYFGDLTHSEIAALLNLPQGTVKGRMRLGLEKMRGQLDEPELE